MVSLIAILEGDDLWINNKLKNQIHFFRNEELYYPMVIEY